MPLDKYTKDFFKDIKSITHTILARLDQLIGIADRPGKDDEKSVKLTREADKENDAKLGDILSILQSGPTPDRRDNPNEKWYKSFQYWNCRSFRWWKDRLEAVAFVFAISYAVITYLQWHDSAKNFRTDERASIEFAASTAPFTPMENQEIAVDVLIKNSGKTLARKLYGYAVIAKLKKGESPSLDLEKPGTTMNINVLYPGKTAENPSHMVFARADGSGIERFTPNHEDIAQWQRGEIYFAIYGKITYLDIFKVEHWTTFCNVFTGINMNTPTKNCTDYADVDAN